jgi:hypothetical protein
MVNIEPGILRIFASKASFITLWFPRGKLRALMVKQLCMRRALIFPAEPEARKGGWEPGTRRADPRPEGGVWQGARALHALITVRTGDLLFSHCKTRRAYTAGSAAPKNKAPRIPCLFYVLARVQKVCDKGAPSRIAGGRRLRPPFLLLKGPMQLGRSPLCHTISASERESTSGVQSKAWLNNA